MWKQQVFTLVVVKNTLVYVEIVFFGSSHC
jgi:hypothetical protein